jgi:hypothetical protein
VFVSYSVLGPTSVTLVEEEANRLVAALDAGRRYSICRRALSIRTSVPHTEMPSIADAYAHTLVQFGAATAIAG